MATLLRRSVLSPLQAVDVPPPRGQYAFPLSPTASQSGAPINGLLNVAPWVLTSPLTLDRLGADFTGAGETGSLFRMGVYADNGTCYPGALLLDSGTIAADATARIAATVAATLPAGLLWIGGATQNVTATLPGLRCINQWTPPAMLATASGVPASSAQLFGYSATGVTGALPSTFPTTRTVAALVPRLFIRPT